jgi:predicted ATPase/class 3 adenylate cyclase
LLAPIELPRNEVLNAAMPMRRHIPELAIEWALHERERRWRVVDGSLCFADISGFTALAERLALRGRVGGEELVETLGRVFVAMLDIAHDSGGMLLKFGGDALLLFFDGGRSRHSRGRYSGRDAARSAPGGRNSHFGRPRSSCRCRSACIPVKCISFLVGGAHRELVLLGPAVNSVVATENAANAGEILVSAATAAALPVTATRARADGERLLRWRRAPPMPKQRRPQPVADAGLIASLFPRQLGTYLATVPEPEHRVACIAFIRFSGTDAMLAQFGPDALAAALDDTVTAIQAHLENEGVSLLTIDIDRDGGKFFLGSGVPYAREDDEGVMLRALRRIAETPVPLTLQMGINRGHVFAAEVGTPNRAAYSAMGDTTNTAARITSKAPAGSIYAHPSVLDQALTLFDVRPAGPFTFKGKKAPQLVYEVGAEIGPRRREGLSVDEFVGRTAELDALRDAIGAYDAKRGGVLCIEGASGIGKSRLVREALSSVAAGSVLSLHAEPYAASGPFRLFRDPLRAMLRIDRGDAGRMPAELSAAVERLDPALTPWLALIGEVAHIDVPATNEVLALQPNFRGERRAAVLVALLEATHPNGLVIVVDDAQWVDEASSELLGALARACEARPWLMLVSTRDTEVGFQPGVGKKLDIGPMSVDDIRALVEIATEAAPLRPDDTGEIVRRADGNPLFAMEIIRAARDAGSLDAVPLSLEAAMASQVDALDTTARRLLRYASVLGHSFSRPVLAELLRTEGREADLSALERLGDFLEADEADGFRFRNGLVRDTTYEGVAYRLRTRLHRVAGTVLERDAEDANADALALHFARGDDPSRTWRYARIAADRARRAYANTDAARHYELALEASKRLAELDPSECARVWADLGAAREHAGDLQRAFEAFRQALRIVRDDPIARADLLFGRARAKERAGMFSAALRDLTVGLRMVEGDESAAAARARARLNSFAAMVLFGQDRAETALARARLALVQARNADDKTSVGRALVVIDLALTALEGPSDGRHLKEALAIFENLEDITMQAVVRGNLGFLNAHACRWDEAIDWLTSSRLLDQRAGDSITSAYAAINIGEILVNQRRLDEAEATLQEALRVLRASAVVDGVASIEIELARIAIERGDWASAEALLDHACAEFTRLGKSTFLLEATLVRADGLLRGGNPHPALALLDNSRRKAFADPHLVRPKTAWVRGRILSALGRFDEANEEFAAGLEVAIPQRLQYDEARLRQARYDSDLSRGGPADSEDARRAAALFADLGVRNTPRSDRAAN